MFHFPAASSNACRHSKLFLAFLVFLTLLVVSNSEVIGVDLSGNMKPEKQSHDDSDGLFDPVRRLNRFNFETTILKEHDDAGSLYSGTIKHWVVLFCPPWFEPCQSLEPAFRRLTTEWEEKLNTELFSTQVRFGAVDCATEKTLCNQQNVDTYPFVGFYRSHKQVARWRGESENLEADQYRLRDWVQKRLESIGKEKPGSTGTSLDRNLRHFKAWFMEVTKGGQVFAVLVFACIAAKTLFTSLDKLRGEAADEQSGSSTVKLSVKNAGAVPTASASGAERPSSNLSRSLPKAWGTDRTSIEL